MLESPEQNIDDNSSEKELKPEVIEQKFQDALEKFKQELEEKGYNWISKYGSRYVKKGKYYVFVNSDRYGDAWGLYNVWGEGDNFEDAFRNAIDALDKRIDKLDELDSKE